MDKIYHLSSCSFIATIEEAQTATSVLLYFRGGGADPSRTPPTSSFLSVYVTPPNSMQIAPHWNAIGRSLILIAVKTHHMAAALTYSSTPLGKVTQMHVQLMWM